MNIASSNTIIDLQKATVEIPPKNLWEQSWIIALIGSFSGILFVQFIDFLRERRKGGKILIGLHREVSLINAFYSQNLPIINETIEDLRKGKRFSLPYAEQTFDEIYAMYLTNLIFLNPTLDSEICLLFRYTKLINSASKIFSEISNKYRIGDPSIMQKDVVAMLSDISDKIQKALALGRIVEQKLNTEISKGVFNNFNLKKVLRNVFYS